MPKEKQAKQLCVDDLRHTEYYGMQETFDELYARSGKGEIFTDLMGLILSRENILLAYRNIKANTGSNTPGTDGVTIKDIGRLSPDMMVEKVRFIVQGSRHGYRPKPVRRKDIPKPYDPSATRPLGIPCMWDRLIQQCIKQVMEPICEAKFSNNSYGFRPGRSAEHAIQRSYCLMQLTKLHYVVEFDIKGFFDNVNHPKLIKQIWAMGIRDKHLIWIIRQILKAPIKMPDGSMNFPDKGTPQGGIISPLLANIVLNELDHWVESQWQHHPVIHKYSAKTNKTGSLDYGNGYKAMKKSRLKEMYIVRYADDFRIFCRTKADSEKAKLAITGWLLERLKLEVSEQKTRVVNVKRLYSDFLGFKIKVHLKGQRYVVKSHVCDKAIQRQKQKLVEQVKRIAKPTYGRKERDEITLYNSMVMGTQNYYRFATHVSLDFAKLQYAVRLVLYNRLKQDRGSRLCRTGRTLTKVEKEKYGGSRLLRYVTGTGEPIYPIGCIQHKNPIAKKRNSGGYTPEGRQELHNNLRINVALMLEVMRQPLYGNSAEYADNRISLFSAQWGKCAVTGRKFECAEDIHCHHKTPKSVGGTDKYSNLVLVLTPIHRLIHATDSETIRKYLNALNLTDKQLCKLNKYREMAGVPAIA
jgi:group II intron reverse transcriptase/maturase